MTCDLTWSFGGFYSSRQRQILCLCESYEDLPEFSAWMDCRCQSTTCNPWFERLWIWFCRRLQNTLEFDRFQLQDLFRSCSNLDRGLGLGGTGSGFGSDYLSYGKLRVCTAKTLSDVTPTTFLGVNSIGWTVH